jgi:murein DD-endopeptidase MepM/ murein hydrolase activator NlpD
LAVVLAAFAIAGCGPVRRSPAPEPERPAATAPDPEPPTAEADQADGVVHVVREGQTAWRIARAYGVPLEMLEHSNGLNDPTRISVGDVLFIPGVSERLDVPAYPAPVPTPPTGRASRSPGPAPDGVTPLAWPLLDTRVLSTYGVPRGKRLHKGIDLDGDHGQRVYAAESGTVLYAAATMRGYGKTVILDHGGGLTTLYAHNSALLVRVGDRVERGTAIARVGRTGNASGHHCHFEVRRDDVPVDPMRYLSWDVASRTP